MSVPKRSKCECHSARIEAQGKIHQRSSMPPYKKPNNGREERCRSKRGGERRSNPGQVTFDATLTTRTTVSIEKKTPVHLAPSPQALKPNVTRPPRRQRREEEFRFYLFLTIQNTAIDQGAARCKKTLAPGECIHVGERPGGKHGLLIVIRCT